MNLARYFIVTGVALTIYAAAAQAEAGQLPASHLDALAMPVMAQSREAEENIVIISY